MNPQMPPVNGPRGYRPKNIFDTPNLPKQPAAMSPSPSPEPKSHRKLILIIVAVVIVILAAAVVLAQSLGKHETKQAANTTSTNSDSNSAAQAAATDFSAAIVKQDYNTAWIMTSSAFQKSVPKDKFDALVKPLATYVGKSASLKITDQKQAPAVSISGVDGSSQAASYVFELSKSSSENEFLRVNVSEFSGKWQVYGILYQPTKLSADVTSSGQYFVSNPAK